MISEYLSKFRRLSTHYEFKDYLNEALRGHLVCGLRNKEIQRKLLAEANFTLTKA